MKRSQTAAPRQAIIQLVEPVVYPCDLLPAGQPGQVRINGAVYHVLAICDPARSEPGNPCVLGYRLVNPAGQSYDLHEDCGELCCECWDFLASKQGTGTPCKHGQAVRKLQSEGAIL